MSEKEWKALIAALERLSSAQQSQSRIIGAIVELLQADTTLLYDLAPKCHACSMPATVVNHSLSLEACDRHAAEAIIRATRLYAQEVAASKSQDDTSLLAAAAREELWEDNDRAPSLRKMGEYLAARAARNTEEKVH